MARRGRCAYGPRRAWGVGADGEHLGATSTSYRRVRVRPNALKSLTHSPLSVYQTPHVYVLYTPSARHTQQEPHARFCLCANSCSRTHTSCTVNHYNASPHCLHLVLTLVPNTRPVASLARGPASSRAHACPPLSHIYLASPPVHTTAACLERRPTMMLPTTSAPPSPNVPLRLAWPQHR